MKNIKQNKKYIKNKIKDFKKYQIIVRLSNENCKLQNLMTNCLCPNGRCSVSTCRQTDR
jgi:hypothetical protein